MRTGPQPLWSRCPHAYTSLFQRGRELAAITQFGIDFEEDEIGFNAVEIDLDAIDLGNCLGKQPGVFVVLRQTLDVVLQCVNRRSSRDTGLPQRTAHHLVGTLVGLAMERGVPLAELSLADFQAAEPSLDESVYGVLGVDNAIAAFCSYGSTAPAEVKKQVAAWKQKLNLD